MSTILTSAMLSTSVLSEPDQANPFVAAEGWVQGVLLGSAATAVAIVAVGTFGFLLMTGRLSLRRGLTMVAGCFILFGSNTIANGILAELGTGTGSAPLNAAAPAIVESSPLLGAVPLPAPSHTPYDPYAGAAVPQHQ